MPYTHADATPTSSAFDIRFTAHTQHVVAEVVEVRSPAQAARQIDHALVTALQLKKPVYIEIAWCV